MSASSSSVLMLSSANSTIWCLTILPRYFAASLTQKDADKAFSFIGGFTLFTLVSTGLEAVVGR